MFYINVHYYVRCTSSHEHISRPYIHWASFREILVLLYLRRTANISNRLSKNLHVKLLKLYYKETSTTKLEREKTFEETGGALSDTKSGNK